jgi:anaerobic ribonucleoside-triphosphate reductase
MTVIQNATKKLVEKINSCCPQCNIPGFGITDAKRGLKCSLCGSATIQLFHLYMPTLHTKEEMHQKKTTEDPMYCDYCKP